MQFVRWYVPKFMPFSDRRYLYPAGFQPTLRRKHRALINLCQALTLRRANRLSLLLWEVKCRIGILRFHEIIVRVVRAA